MSISYTKLFSSILDSTVWRESNSTRILWVTLLAMCDRNGVVEASIPGLADRARLTIAETEAALEVLSSPDQYSRSRDHEGRRIAETDGGWRILNHEKYRKRLSKEERLEYVATWKRENRRQKRQEGFASVGSVEAPKAPTHATQPSGGGLTVAGKFRRIGDKWSDRGQDLRVVEVEGQAVAQEAAPGLGWKDISV